MISSLAWAALLMGLVGGPHCLAMCAAPCGAITAGGTSDAAQVMRWMPRGGQLWRMAAYHGGRLAGYAFAGGLAALTMDRLAWLTQQTAALRPAWTMLHVAVLAWGLLMMAQARQPAWIEHAGRSAWGRVRPLIANPGGVFAAGFLWALMPCGLLYSALLMAALSGGALQGAYTMVSFGVGSGLWLLAGPWLWQRVRSRLNLQCAGWGTRLAGLMLFGVAAIALWMDLVHHQPAPWCL